MLKICWFFLLFLVSGLAGADSDPIVEMQTNVGTITVKLNKTQAPLSTQNFLSYVNKRFYDQTLFHRFIKGFVLQGGGYSLADAKLKDTDPAIKSESSNGLKNLTYTLAMARSAAVDSATSQFYFNLTDNTGLDYVDANSPGYTVFGAIVDGQAILEKIIGLNAYNISSSAGGLAYTKNYQLIFIERTYATEQPDPANVWTRINVNGVGKVTSSPAGIKCGDATLLGSSGLNCAVSNPLRSGKSVILTATAGSGYVFNGWSGDCFGASSAFKFVLNKNRNCTANFQQIPS